MPGVFRTQSWNSFLRKVRRKNPISVNREITLVQRGNSRDVRSNAGLIFKIGIDPTNGEKLKCVRATDPTGLWSPQDILNQPATDNGPIQAYHYAIADDKIHVVFQRVRDGDAIETVLYARFDMTTSSWVDLGTSEYEIVIKSPDASSQVSCMIAVQFDYICVVFADTVENVSGNRLRAGYAVSSDDGATWPTQAYISGGGGTFNETCPRILAGVAGCVQFVYLNNDGGTNNVMAATLQQDLTLQAAQNTGFDAANLYGLGWPERVWRGELVMNFPYAGSAADTQSLRFDSTTAVTTFDSDQIVAAQPYQTGTYTQAQVACVYDGFKMYAVTIHAGTRDINHYVEAALGSYAWTAEGTIETGTFNVCAAGFYDHNGPKLGLTYSDGTAASYSETDKNTVRSTLSSVRVGLNVSWHGPFLIGGSIYTPLISSSQGRIVMMKAANTSPANGDWDSQDNALVVPTYDDVAQHWNPGGTKNSNGIRSIWSVEVGTDIDVYAAQESGSLTLSVFDTTTDTWTTRLEHITNGWDANFGGVTFGAISAGHDSVNGHKLCLANWHEKTTPYEVNDFKVRIFRKASGGSWTNLGNAGGVTASTNYHTGNLIGPDSSGGFTVTYTDITNNVLYGRYIAADGTINSPFTVDAAVDTSHLLVGRGVAVANTVHVPYVDADNDISIAEFTAGASPSVTISTGASKDPAYRHSTISRVQPGNHFGLIAPDSVARLLYVSSVDQDVYLDDQTTAIIPSVTVAEGLSANYLSAALGVGFILDNAATTEFYKADLSTEILATTDALSITENAASISVDVGITATTDALSLTAQSASIAFDIEVTATTDALTLTQYAAAISTDANTNISATSDALTLTQYAASIANDVEVTTSVDTLALTGYAASVALDISINATTDSLALTNYAASISNDVTVAASLDTLILSAFQASVVGGATVATPSTRTVTAVESGRTITIQSTDRTVN